MPLYAPRLPLIGTNGTVTASTPLLDLTQTWNNVAVQFTGLKANVTDTASTSNSLLMDLQVGGTSKFQVYKDGAINALGGTSTFFSIQLGSTSNLNWNADTRLFRDAANTLALRNGAAVQTFNVYNTYTDASNYERVSFGPNGIVGQNAGTGAIRTLAFGVNNGAQWQISTGGNFHSALDNTYDIGASGANRPRTIYAGTNIFAGAALVATNSIYPTSASRSQINSPADGQITFINNAGTDFSRLMFGGTTSAFPSLKRASTDIQARLADDSAFSAIRASTFVWGLGSRFGENADGVNVLLDSTGANYGRLQFGGSTSSFPALKRSGNSLVVRLADDSADSNIRAGQFTYPLGSRIGETADGVLFLQNAAQTDFSRLQFGGTSASFPALKRNGSELYVRLADDSAFTLLVAGGFLVPAATVATLPSAVARTGQRRFVSDASGPVFGSAVTGGGAVNVPVYSDGTVWRVG
jgi:hypothetical protein